MKNYYITVGTNISLDTYKKLNKICKKQKVTRYALLKQLIKELIDDNYD